MKFKYTLSLSDENLVAKLRCAVNIKCATDFEDSPLKKKKERKTFPYWYLYWLLVEMIKFGIYWVT